MFEAYVNILIHKLRRMKNIRRNYSAFALEGPLRGGLRVCQNLVMISTTILSRSDVLGDAPAR